MPTMLMADSMAVKSLNILTFFCPLQQNLQADVTSILKSLIQGENMSDLDNKKVIILVQLFPELYLPQPETYPDVTRKAVTSKAVNTKLIVLQNFNFKSCNRKLRESCILQLHA